MSNVVPLEGLITSLDIPPARVIAAAAERRLKDCVIVGHDEDGELYFASSVGDGGAVLWMFEKAKLLLLGVDL